jgi:hypothetical protein
MRSTLRWALAAAALVGCADPVPVAPPEGPPPESPPPAEASQLVIVNGEPGITSLRIVVDGQEQQLTGLRPNEVRAVRAGTPVR